MEELNTQPNNELQLNSELIISDMAIGYLKETAKWTKFLSIAGFVIVGLIIIIGFLASTIMSSIPSSEFSHLYGNFGFMYGVMYVVIGIIYFFPTWFLFNFSNKLKSAINSNNSEELSIAFSSQKSFFKFIGIFALIIVSLYALGIAAAIIFFSLMM